MKKNSLKWSLILIGLFLCISACISKQQVNSTQSPCDCVDVEWLRKHAPIPQGEIASKSEKNGLCEVILKIKNQFVPIYAGDNFIVAGEMFQERVQITESKMTALKENAASKAMTDIDKAVAFTYTPQKSSGPTLYMLTDPLCKFCKKAGDGIKPLADKYGVTIKTILYPVTGEKGMNKSVEAICKGFSLDEYLAPQWKEGSETFACEKADDLLDRSVDLASNLGIRGVPYFIFEDGKSVNGANMKKLEKVIKHKLSLQASR